MVGLIILGIIVILLIALNLTPIALHISYEDALSVLAKIGTINLQIYPKEEKEKSEKKESGERKKEAQKTDAKEKKSMSFKDFSPNEIKSLLRIVFEALSSFRKRLQIREFKFWYVSSYEDPYKTAQSYNLANSLLCSIGGMADQYLHFKDVDIRTAADYSVGKPYYNISIVISIRLGELVHVAFRAGSAALRIIRKHKKREKQVSVLTANPEAVA